MVKKLFLGLISISLLLGDDTIILYKTGGKKLIEKEMLSVNYWNNALFNKDLRFGYFERALSLLTVNKKKGSLELYTSDSQKRFSLRKRYRAFTGKNVGDKFREGDLKTPIGIYTLTEKRKKVDPFYGPMAFVTSYPNLYDRIRGKSGDGIWIHGVPLTGSRDPFTRGCVAINNDDLLQLDKSINPSNTLLIIDSSSKQWVNPNAYTHILAALYQWKAAWSDNDLETYLSFYDATFKRADGMNFNQFKHYKERIFSKNESKSITFNNINIIPYPGEVKNLYWVTFNQIYQSDSHRFVGNKVVLIQLNQDKSISILTED
ncbi:MAG: L,D-transpeptidase family protein [Epsilonproteobacteria bacterium]|nr:L,D-transpeptidase family protein [Campylobacterota bacterium]